MQHKKLHDFISSLLPFKDIKMATLVNMSWLTGSVAMHVRQLKASGKTLNIGHNV